MIRDLPRRPISTTCLLALALAATAARGQDTPAAEAIVESDATVTSRGKPYAVDVFAPRAPGTYPAVVLVHGHGGLGEGTRSGLHDQARRLAGAGYVAAVPRYFGETRPDPKNGRKNYKSFAVWERTVDDVVSWAAKRSDVDPTRIGLVGSSLGSSVVLSVAARDRRISAVVENFGSYPAWEDLDPARLPPILIFHGDADRVVPVDEARTLEGILRGAGVDHEVRIYPGADHGFRGADRADSLARTTAFLDEHVKRSPRRPSPPRRAPSHGPSGKSR